MLRPTKLLRKWRTSSPFQHLGISLLGGLGIALVIVTVTILFGQVRGEEFSPQMFRRRQFHYIEIPLLGIQVWPIDRRDTTNSLERYVGQLSQMATSSTSNRWDLVRVARGGRDWEEGNVLILCMYLDAMNSQDQLHWHIWSQQNPELATELWPVVSRLAEKRMYSLVPVAFGLASAIPDAITLRQRLAASLAGEYLALAVARRKMGRHRQALQRIEDGLELDPQNRPLLQERERIVRHSHGTPISPDSEPP